MTEWFELKRAFKDHLVQPFAMASNITLQIKFLKAPSSPTLNSFGDLEITASLLSHHLHCKKFCLYVKSKPTLSLKLVSNHLSIFHIFQYIFQKDMFHYVIRHGGEDDWSILPGVFLLFYSFYPFLCFLETSVMIYMFKMSEQNLFIIHSSTTLNYSLVLNFKIHFWMSNQGNTFIKQNQKKIKLSIWLQKTFNHQCLHYVSLTQLCFACLFTAM